MGSSDCSDLSRFAQYCARKRMTLDVSREAVFLSSNLKGLKRRHGNNIHRHGFVVGGSTANLA